MSGVQGYLVQVRRDGELRITTDAHIECFARERIMHIVRTPYGVEIKTPDRWHAFRLTPALADAAMRCAAPPEPPNPPPVRTTAPARRRMPAYKERAVMAALTLVAGTDELSLVEARRRSGADLHAWNNLTGPRGALRGAYERAMTARRALADVRSVARGKGDA